MTDAKLQATYDELCRRSRESGVLESISSLLAWDEQTKMPAAGAEHRAEQYTLVSNIMHEKATDPELGRLLDDLDDSPLAADLHSVEGANIRMVRRRYDHAVKLPAKLVEEMARTSVLGRNAWIEARKNDDFATFRPWLEKTVDLKHQEAECLGYDEHQYDALIDQYEPGAKTGEVLAVLKAVGEQLSPIIRELTGSDPQPDTSILHRNFPADVQEKFASQMAAKIGYDFDRGRLDVTTHPFCCTPGPCDVRITTRYNESFFNESFFGTLHEAGHGIYEQGLPDERFGLPSGEAVSLGMHESQSRMWENMVGRSRAFWQYAMPMAQKAFPDSLGNVDADTFFRAINRVQPSLIRVEADETTYNLHVLIRMELELALMDGRLKAADAPDAWNAKYEEYLGIHPASDREGVLQDVHWSQGCIGYFPTYSLGNMFAAQMFEQAESDLGDLNAMFAQGDFEPLRTWLGKNVHQLGQQYWGNELIEKITGEPLKPESFIKYLKNKLASVYEV